MQISNPFLLLTSSILPLNEAQLSKSVIKKFKESDGIYDIEWDLKRRIELDLINFSFSLFMNGKTVMVWNSRSLLSMEFHGGKSVSQDVSFHGFPCVYGIPEHASSLALKTTGKNGYYKDPYRLKNLDVFEFGLDKNTALYGSAPLMVAKNNEAMVGFLLYNGSEMWIDIKNGDDGEISTHWMMADGAVENYFFLESDVPAFYKSYASLTGFPFMPPLFSLGYHQCRWNYNSQKDVLDVNRKFDDHGIPMDVMWLDIEHTNGKKYFTWDKTNFPNPISMENELSLHGRKTVVIVDPHIKVDKNYHIYQEALKKNYLVKNSNGYNFEGNCWPGRSSWIDFVNPDARKWWSEQFQYDKYVKNPFK